MVGMWKKAAIISLFLLLISVKTVSLAEEIGEIAATYDTVEGMKEDVLNLKAGDFVKTKGIHIMKKMIKAEHYIVSYPKGIKWQMKRISLH